jgi:hypothetical protein
MKFTVLCNTELLVLKSKLCGLELTSRKFSRQIIKSKGDRRWNLRFRKSALGVHTREHLIAYGLLRNIPYERIEAKCQQGNQPRAGRIAEIIRAHVPYHEQAKWTQLHVEKLLKRGD